jgi:hypothetical protein
MVEVFYTKSSKQNNKNNPKSYFCLSPKDKECYDYEDKDTDDAEAAIFVIAAILKSLEESHTKIVMINNKNPLFYFYV